MNNTVKDNLITAAIVFSMSMFFKTLLEYPRLSEFMFNAFITAGLYILIYRLVSGWRN